MKVFGIGCIYFGYSVQDRSSNLKFIKNKYTNDLRKKLESLENVSDLIFENEDTSYGSMISIEKEDKNILVPILNEFKISFDIFIPFRVQDQIFSRCDVEKIHVDIIYGYEMPLTVASYDWPDEEGDAQPSKAVVVVRKFLDKKLTAGDFICGCVGPSPFHANFAVIESDLIEIPSLDDVSEDFMGYANIEIVASRNCILLDVILSTKLDSILSQFYYLSELRSRAIDAQTAIILNSQHLLDQKSPTNLKERFSAFRSHSESVDTLNSKIFHEMLLRLNMSQALAESDRTEITGQNQILNRFFEEYRSISSEQTWSKFSEVAKFFEERRQKLIGNAASIFAGVVGGVIGSIIGSLATYLLTGAK